jgi:anti-sigma28 factor (negative regulator of flagellin synthesis)
MSDDEKRGRGRPPGKYEGTYKEGALYDEVALEVYKMHGYKPDDRIPKWVEEYVLTNALVFAKKLPAKMRIAFTMRYRKKDDDEEQKKKKKTPYREIGEALRNYEGNPDSMSEKGARDWVERARERIIKKLNNGLYKMKAEKNGS